MAIILTVLIKLGEPLNASISSKVKYKHVPYVLGNVSVSQKRNQHTHCVTRSRNFDDICFEDLLI